MMYAKTPAAKVAGGSVVSTGTFAEMIAPASPFKEGMDPAKAKAEFGVYPISGLQETDTKKTVIASPYFSASDDAVYNVTLANMTVAERKAAMKAKARAAALARSRAGTTTTLGGQSVTVASTDEAVARLQGVPRYLTASGDSAMNVVMSSGAPVAMTAAMAATALAAVDALYAACEGWQYAKYTAISSATTHAQLTAIDITTGLPA